MLQNLPESIFWDILRRTDDVKACVAVWTSSKERLFKYTIDTFWETMCFYHFNVRQEMRPVDGWKAMYWWNYRNKKGCAYCQRHLPNEGIAIPSKSDSIHINGNDVFVCKRCKILLGDSVIHGSILDPWQIALIKKLKGSYVGTLFSNYYGENQVQKCHKLQMKCVKCISNIRNDRCTLLQCGVCCHCKYHKSHYDQAMPDDRMMSFDIVQLIQKVSITKKKRKANIMIVHI